MLNQCMPGSIRLDCVERSKRKGERERGKEKVDNLESLKKSERKNERERNRASE